MSLNVYNAPYSFRLHPMRWIKHKVCKAPKEAKLRAKYGYCDGDMWNMNEWMCETFSEMLYELSNRAHGHPYDMSEQEWKQWLREMSERFNLLREDNWYKTHKNHFAALLNQCRQTPHLVTVDYDSVRKKYLEEEEKINASYMAYARQTFLMLAKRFPDLWD